MNREKYKIGKYKDEWGNGEAQTLTFIVTEDCNLRCKYCYITHKSKGKSMPIEVAKQFIDYIMTSKTFKREKAVILEFIGGEPLLEAKLIDDICDYFKIRTFELEDDWYWNYRISITTNGVNYSEPSVQKLIEKNEGKISIGITIDGIKEKHDLHRVFPDGSGSYDIIHKNLKLWMKQFPGFTKVTFASEDLKYLKDSIINLWKEGITEVAANVVYENVWKEGDDRIFEEQIRLLGDYILEHDLYNDYYCTLFLDSVGLPYEKEDMNSTSCGAGKMVAVNARGDLYPCIRYYDYSLNHRKGYVIGNVKDGIDYEKIRPFLLAMYKYQCDEECLNCPVAKGCEFCQGFNYDEADTETNFQKAKYICKMHKARVRALNYYYARLFHEKGIKREGFYWKQELVFLLSDNFITTCSYRNEEGLTKTMSRSEIEKGLRYAEEHFMRPIFIHSKEMKESEYIEYNNYEILHRIPITAYKKDMPFYEYEIIVNVKNLESLQNIPYQESIILNIKETEILQLYSSVEKVLKVGDRVNINITDLSSKILLQEYQNQLSNCVELLEKIYLQENILKEINVITDLLFINEHEGCPAGDTQVTYAADGKFYICPAFYKEGDRAIGTPETGIEIKNSQLLKQSHMPLCNMCSAFQCENCKFLNKKETYEVNVSPSYQCMKAQIERQASYKLQKKLAEVIDFSNHLKNEICEDPILKLKKEGMYTGYYM